MKVVIIGGVAAGPKSGTVLARRLPEAEIVLFQREKNISYGTCGLPYFASGDIGSFTELINTSYGTPRDSGFFKKTKGITVKPETEVISIDRSAKKVKVKDLKSGEVFEESYDKLVIATGANPVKAPFEIPESDRIEHFTRPEDAVNFRKKAETGQVGKAVVIGGGFIGCELAEAASSLWGIETVLIEKEDQLLPYVLDKEMSKIVEREMARQDVRVHLGTAVEKIKLSDDGNPIVRIEGENIETDYIFLCLGVRPEVSLANESGLDLGTTGGIKVNRHLQTSDSDIYAGGDCIESYNLISKQPLYIPMGSLANRHGRVIAENIAGGDETFNGVTGAFFVKVFDKNVGAVGLSETAAEDFGIETGTVWGSFPDKPDYYPEVKTLVLKLVYEKNTERLLGLQAVGNGDIFRRIDVMSTFLYDGKRIDDLFDFEHGYAPPYSEAMDPLHQLAGLAKAKTRGIDIASFDFVKNCDMIWLDVREPEEIAVLPWPSDDGRVIKSITLNDLREHLDELDKEKQIYIVCRRGPRSYQAAVILRNAGFKKVAVLGGGTQAALS